MLDYSSRTEWSPGQSSLHVRLGLGSRSHSFMSSSYQSTDHPWTQSILRTRSNTPTSRICTQSSTTRAEDPQSLFIRDHGRTEGGSLGSPGSPLSFLIHIFYSKSTRCFLTYFTVRDSESASFMRIRTCRHPKAYWIIKNSRFALKRRLESPWKNFGLPPQEISGYVPVRDGSLCREHFADHRTHRILASARLLFQSLHGNPTTTTLQVVHSSAGQHFSQQHQRYSCGNPYSTRRLSASTHCLIWSIRTRCDVILH